MAQRFAHAGEDAVSPGIFPVGIGPGDGAGYLHGGGEGLAAAVAAVEEALLGRGGMEGLLHGQGLVEGQRFTLAPGQLRQDPQEPILLQFAQGPVQLRLGYGGMHSLPPRQIPARIPGTHTRAGSAS